MARGVELAGAETSHCLHGFAPHQRCAVVPNVLRHRQHRHEMARRDECRTRGIDAERFDTVPTRPGDGIRQQMRVVEHLPVELT